MNELRCLLSLELPSLYGINKFLHTRDPKARSRYYLLTGVFAILLLVVFAYVGGLVYGLCLLDLGRIVPAYLTTVASLVILAFGIFTAGPRVFGRTGYDLLASLPLKSRHVVLSRMAVLYLEDLLLTLVIFLPGLSVYGLCCHPGLGFYLAAALAVLLIPAIPLVISILLGTLVLAISCRMKNKSMVQSILLVLLVVGILVSSFSLTGIAEGLTPEYITQLAQAIGSLIGQLYPPAMWLNQALIGGSILHLGLFALVSVALLAFAVLLTQRLFHSTVRRLHNFSSRHNYQIGAMESRGLLKALYLREAKRYFSSSIYVTNTIVGPILGAILAISLCIMDLDSLENTLPVDISVLLPYGFAAVFCMMTTTCTSISMEGKQFWAIQSLPIPTKTLLDSKILLNLSLMLPFYVVSVIAMAIATQGDFLQLLWLVTIPAAISLFSTVFGITVNLRFHSFEWEKEEAVVKQSLPAALGGFAGFLLSALLGGAIFLLPRGLLPLGNSLVLLIVLAGTAGLYRKNNKAILSQL